MRQKKEKNNGKGDSAQALSRFASLSEGEMQQNLRERYFGKTKQITNWSVSTFKGKLKFFRFKLVEYKTGAFNRKFEIKPIPILLNISLNAKNHFWYCCPFFASDLRMHNSTGYVIKLLVRAFSCALSSYGALGKFEEHSRSFFRALQTSRVLHNSMLHAKAWTNC